MRERRNLSCNCYSNGGKLTLFRPSFFRSFPTRGEGGSRFSKIIKAKRTKLGGYIQYVQKSFFWRINHLIMTSNDVDFTSWFPNSRQLRSAILDFLIFPNRQKTKKNDSKLIKTNKRMLKWSKTCHWKLFSLQKKTNIANLEKYACKNMVSMVTASSVNNDMSYQIGKF